MKKILVLLLCCYSVVSAAQTDLKTNEQNAFRNGLQIDLSYRTGFFNEWHWRSDSHAYSTGDYYRDWSMFNHCFHIELSNTYYLKNTSQYSLGLKAIWTKSGGDLFRDGGLAGLHLGLGGLGFIYAKKLTSNSGLEFYVALHSDIPLSRGVSAIVGIGGELEVGGNFRYKNWSFGISGAGYAASVVGGYVSGPVYGIMTGMKIGYQF